MKTRIITALVCVPLLVAAILSGSIVITVAVIAVSLIGTIEFYRAVGIYNKRTLCAAGYAFCIIVPLLPWITRFFDSTKLNMILIFIAMLFLFFIMLRQHKDVKITDVSLVIFSTIYIPYFLSNILKISLLDNGHFYIWLVFIGAFLTDSFAYFIGIFFGKHKLCPEISPKKTIEGAIGGVVGCVLSYFVYGIILNNFFSLNINYVEISVLGFLVAIVAEFGDLVASIIKRWCKIKDYGTLFPGHGGILDRCDSVILVSPMIYLFLSLIGI